MAAPTSSASQPPRLNDLPEELTRAFFFRVAEYLRRRSRLQQFSLLEKHNQIRDLASKLHFVGGKDHRHSIPRQVAHDVQHFGHQLRVKCRGDFIEKQRLRLHGNGADDGDTLLLAAGKLIGVVLRPVSEIDALQQVAGAL
ncbi:hypothetical protein J2Y48_004445 [Mycoplana sp. BE70]|nr:hypothetical protein [Mycoplana sp. BE70]